MRKLAKGLLIGGAVGAGVAGVMAFRDESDTGPVGPRVAKAAAQAAAVGAAIGWLLDRRDRARLAQARRSGLGGALVGAAESALPVIQYAADVAARRAAEAADVAWPYVESAADTVRARAGEVAEAARPYVESAADTVRARAGDVAGATRPHVESALQSARGWAPSLPSPSFTADDRTVIVAV
jgi:hypothetical protein